MYKLAAPRKAVYLATFFSQLPSTGSAASAALAGSGDVSLTWSRRKKRERRQGAN